MAMRGSYIGLGYVAGLGNVRVFQDLDSKDGFFVSPLKKDETRYKNRALVHFRKERKNGAA